MTICIALQSKRKIPSYSTKQVSNIDLFSLFPFSLSLSLTLSLLL